MRIVKICQYCKNEFIAKKTNSRTCSDTCAKRLYKRNQRNKKIAHAEIKTKFTQRPDLFIEENQMRAIQVKENLTLKEAAILLNISALTLRRWILSGKVKSDKVGRKHLILKSTLLSNNVPRCKLHAENPVGSSDWLSARLRP